MAVKNLLYRVMVDLIIVADTRDYCSLGNRTGFAINQIGRGVAMIKR